LSRSSASHALSVDRRAYRAENLLDLPSLVLEARDSQRAEQAEGDGAPVGQRIAGCGFQGVRERVPEVQLSSLSAVERIAEADGGLERGAAANLLGDLELPEWLAREEAGLYDLGAAVFHLLRRKRVDGVGINDGPRRPVKGSHEVLAFRDVDRRLAADTRVDLRQQSCGSGHPGDTARVGGGDETRHIDRGTTPERNDGPVSTKSQR